MDIPTEQFEEVVNVLKAIHDQLRDYKNWPDPNSLEIIMSALDDATTALTAAVAENTTATQAIVTALAAAGPSATDISAVTDATTAIAANTAALNAAVTPPPPEAPVVEPAT